MLATVKRVHPLMWGIVAAIVAAIVAIILSLGGGSTTPSADAAGTSAVPSATSASSASTAGACHLTWKMTSSTPSNGNWSKNGVPSIAAAKTKAQASAAAKDWLNAIEEYPGTLSGASAYLLHKNVTPASLMDSKGCATSAATGLVNELQVALSLSDISPSQAPANGVNTGTKNGVVFANTTSGIIGDRRAIKVTLKDGSVVWIMARCGNPVTPPTTPPPVHRVTLPNCHTTGTCYTPPPPPPTTPNCHQNHTCYTPPPPPHHGCSYYGTCPTTPPPSSTPPSSPPVTCESVYGPGYNGTYPNCTKAAVGPSTTYVPPPPVSAPGTNPAPVPVPTTGANGQPTTQPTSSQCYVNGKPAAPGTPGAWCS